ncbi:MAG TPA: phospholipase D-like domain-containing protein [Spirochaetota bacterium]|nr:phospholipase D-like domain-containing protein [Spirochaetota bacterium]HOM37541.1 phospholipase D-like domain-containing protein [Spirochaetota bacterium]HPQ49487.1 phospholipase D-like domain-containing protein [Spirochaetota bacterium]
MKKTLFLLPIFLFFFSCFEKPVLLNNNSILVCTDKDCFEDIIKTIIQTSKKSIDIALYEFYNQDIYNLLLDAYKRGVIIRGVTDYDSQKNSGWEILSYYIPVIYGNSNGIMHNKYIIVDDRFVFTGSLNFTTDLGKNYNSVILIDNKDLASVYKQDFEKMFVEKKFSSNKDDSGCIDIGLKKIVGNFYITVFFTPYTYCYETINGAKILLDNPYTPIYDPKDYTNPIGYKVLALIDSAISSIDIIAFSLTDELIIYKIKERALNNIKIRIYLDYSQFKANYSYIYQYLEDLYNSGVDIKIVFNYDKKLHHKVIIIDKNTIIMGSMNFSNNAVNDNDENFVIIENAYSIYSVFEREIAKIEPFSFSLNYFKSN